MQEYIADKEIGKKLYRQKRKLYKRYKIGMVSMTVFLLVMLFINFILVQKAENMYQIIENLFIGIGIDVFFVIGAGLSRALAISGGREVMMSRVREKCVFTEHYFILEYVPHVHETTEYECIQFRIKYRDIQKMIDEDMLGRLAVYGEYETLKYRTINSEQHMTSYMVSDMPLYVYGYYREFDFIKRELQRRVQNNNF